MNNINYRLALIVLLSFLIFSCNTKEATDKVESQEEVTFNIPDGFLLEELYNPSAYEQGSWVALAKGPKETLFACDQYGKIYEFSIPQEGKILEKSDIKPIDLDVGSAHGLLWAFNSLYVAVNKRWDEEIPDDEENGSGIYRLTDSDDDGKLDTVKMLLKLEGEGEHGPHSFALSPDGTAIYFIAGNHTLISEAVSENSRLPTNWGEDNLFEPYLDARGHANDIKAPGGWVCKFDSEGNNWELISAGYRNAFDIAFNEDEELFAYDADMEWDIGMPWYRPTRICHVTSGSEYGWRTGSGKWPEYYPDALPAVHNLEQGSPTAVLSGATLDFPKKYANGLLVMDWSFGTVYFIDLKPEGSSYTAEREEFLSGTPLPLTDMVAGTDGNLYFATGGRRIDSHLYRLSYKGNVKNTAETAFDTPESNLRDLRHAIEKYHVEESTEGTALAWNHLNHEDRFIRYASRVVLENQPVDEWFSLFEKEKDAIKIIEASIALAHQGKPSMQSKVLDRLNTVNLESLTSQQQLDFLRSFELQFIRLGQPNETQRLEVAKKLNKHFPHEDSKMNRELGQLLLYLKADGITEGLVALLEKNTKERNNDTSEYLPEETTLRSEQYGPLIREIIAKMPPSEAIYYGVLLSHADSGWTKESRETYFQWFYDVLNAKGGLSFKPGMENIRLAAMENVPKDEKKYFQELSGVYSPTTAIAEIPQPIGPGGQYGGKEIGEMLWGDALSDFEVDFESGERAYQAGMCILCHRMRGEGGAAGPDLTQAHTKFNNYEMIFAVYSPNDEISDQYANTLFHMEDGKKLSGRIKKETDDLITLMPNPFNEGYTIELQKDSVLKRELSPLSPMPSGLLNRLNPKEIKNLFAYIQAGGDENHEVYQQNKEF